MNDVYSFYNHDIQFNLQTLGHASRPSDTKLHGMCRGTKWFELAGFGSAKSFCSFLNGAVSQNALKVWCTEGPEAYPAQN